MVSITNSDDRITMNYSRPFHNNHIITRHAYASKNVQSENVEFHIERALYSQFYARAFGRQVVELVFGATNKYKQVIII